MIAKIKGTRDYFGNESKRFLKVIKILEEVSKEYSLEKIVTPTFEKTELFSRGVGNDTDVVNKEMYTFEDKKGRSFSLRPEGTASTVRLALENKLLDNNNQQDLFYISPMFRYERPQKGRQREFYQYGVERFGKDSIYTDVETIMIATTILNKLNISKYELTINSIGLSQDRQSYNKALKEFVEQKINDFSEYAKEKYSTGNVMRIFDSKIQSDLDALVGAPSISDFLNEESKVKFEQVKDLLTKSGIQYKIDENLVRGLDYYNDVVFEFVSTDVENLGSKSTIIGGGRYDSLVNKFDESKNVSAVGFAIGLERLMLAATEFLDNSITNELDYFVAVAYAEEEMQTAALQVSSILREKGNSVKVDFSKKKLPKKFDQAEKLGSNYVVIVGNEVTNGMVTIKNIKDGTSAEVSIKEI